MEKNSVLRMIGKGRMSGYMAVEMHDVERW
jgi:hypothetical protein